MDWFVYIIECSDKTLYTGISSKPLERFAMHQKGRGAKYTKGRGPLALKYLTKTGSKNEALMLEHKIKQLPRSKKLSLINLENLQTTKFKNELHWEEP